MRQLLFLAESDGEEEDMDIEVTAAEPVRNDEDEFEEGPSEGDLEWERIKEEAMQEFLQKRWQ